MRFLDIIYDEQEGWGGASNQGKREKKILDTKII